MGKKGEHHDETLGFKMVERELKGRMGYCKCVCFLTFWGFGFDFGGSLPKHIQDLLAIMSKLLNEFR
jgi:hypothetical protein